LTRCRSWLRSRLTAIQAPSTGDLEPAGSDRVKRALDLAVDSFILEWWPRPGPRPGPRRGTSERRKQEYLENRGYWEDLWARVHTSSLHERRGTAVLSVQELDEHALAEYQAIVTVSQASSAFAKLCPSRAIHPSHKLGPAKL
jgi:hypothetical protein